VNSSKNDQRDRLLCDVAAMYYEQDLNQQAIARKVGLTRSMVSRLLTEARKKHLVTVTIRWPDARDPAAERELGARFGLQAVTVVRVTAGQPEGEVTGRCGEAAARLLEEHLTARSIVGVGWGRAVRATVDAATRKALPGTKVLQLVGAVGARSVEYDGHAAVQALAEKIGGEAFYLHTPFMVDSRRTARVLLDNPSVRDTVALYRECDVLVSGIGSTAPEVSSYHRAGYVASADLRQIRAWGAVGDVCGRHFDLQGRPVAPSFDARIMAIGAQELGMVTLRLGVACGVAKAVAMLGALRSRYLNALVTDSDAAAKLLRLAGQPR
jgi:DNA-binding transcriptional regulator LsrR (DeoR family)